MDSDFFKTWGDLLEKSEVVELRPGQVLFYENHSPYGIYVIQDGQVDIVLSKGQGEMVVGSLPLNAPIGLDTYLSQGVYSYRAVARTHAKIWFLGKSVLRDVVDDHTVHS